MLTKRSLTTDGIIDIRILHLCKRTNNHLMVLTLNHLSNREDKHAILWYANLTLVSLLVNLAVMYAINIHTHSWDISYIWRMEGLCTIEVLLVDGDDIVTETRHHPLHRIEHHPVLLGCCIMEVEPMTSVHHDSSFLASLSCSQTSQDADRRCMHMDKVKMILINDSLQPLVAG